MTAAEHLCVLRWLRSRGAGTPCGPRRLAWIAAAFALMLVPAGVRASPASARVVGPLPASDYAMHAACGAPAPGHASCQALRLVPLSAAAKAHTRPLGMSRSVPLSRPASEVCSSPSAAEGCYGLRPQDLHSAYALPTDSAGQQTIALVDAYDDPGIEGDLKVYDEEFKLPPCTAANGCFAKVNENGAASPLPPSEGEWSVEISLDVEIAHAICQSCRIVLVEAQSSSYADLETAERTAGTTMGAQEISNSWSGSEPRSDNSAFDQPGVVITASTGDKGYLNWENLGYGRYVSYPAASPHVIAVGGTRLSLTAEGAWAGETVWNGASTVEPEAGGAGGSGCSTQFPAPAWQRSLANWPAVGCGGNRAFADLSADADPYTGVAIYDSTPLSDGVVPEWFTLGGTSLSSPLIAATFALAGGAGGVEYPAQTFYARALAEPGWVHDVTSGSSGECRWPVQPDGLSGCSIGEESEICSGKAICLAGQGYDGPTGLGSPDGIGAFHFEPKRSQQIQFTSSPPPAASVGSTTYAVSASASSGLAVALSSATPTVCAISDATVSFQAPGTCAIQASQAGNAIYEAAPAIQQSFTVGKGSQQIEWATVPREVTLGAPKEPVTASASSGLPVSMRSVTPSVCAISEERLTTLSIGTCTIEARQEGSADWEPAPALQVSFPVQIGMQRISFTSLPEAPTVGERAYLVSATATSGLSVAFSSTTPSVCTTSEANVNFVGGGTCTIEARQEGDEEWEPAPPAQQSFTVQKRAQTVRFTSNSPASATVGEAPYEPFAVASSGLPASFTSNASSVCSVSGASVSFLSAGTCTIYARQLGDAEYAEAEPWAQQSFAVAPAASGPAPAVETPPSSPLLIGIGSTPIPAPLKPTSSFTLLGAPHVNPRTAAITFAASVQDPGTFSWRLTFAGPARRTGCTHDCRAAAILFAKGSVSVAAGTVRFTVKPDRPAVAALARQASAGHGLRVTALLGFQSLLGAAPASRQSAILIRKRSG